LHLIEANICFSEISTVPNTFGASVQDIRTSKSQMNCYLCNSIPCQAIGWDLFKP